MKNLAGILILSFAMLLVSCAERQEASNVQVSNPTGTRDRVGLAETEQERTSAQFVSGQWGSIVADIQYKDAFNANLKTLVSATMDPATLGYVSPTGTESTFVRFRGRIHLSSDNTVDKSQSFLRIMIKDEYAGQTVDGKTFDEIALFFGKADSGSVNGNRLVVTYKDEFGEVTLDGEMNFHHQGQTFYWGEVRFKNYKHFAGETPWPEAETLGGFSIPMNGIISR